VAKDKYGINQPGGNNGAWSAKKWQGINHTMKWEELMASIAVAGWPRNLWGMAGAVCAAESSRNPFIYNTYKQGHFGLFQISRSAWPEFFAPNGQGMQWVAPWANAKQAYAIYQKQGWNAWEGKTNGAYLAYYPQAMTAAADLGRKTGMHRGDEKKYWESIIGRDTYGYVLRATGAGEAIVGAANEAVGSAVGDAADATAEGVVDSGAIVAKSVNENFGWLRDAWQTLTTPAIWMRFAYGMTGAALVAGGLFLIVRNTSAGQAAGRAASRAANAATTAIPAGRAVKAVKQVAAAKATAAAAKPAAAPKPAPKPKPAAPKGARK
jgi:hypothetical protein